MEQKLDATKPENQTNFALKNVARRGVIIGKFMPLTTGHCHLIESARQLCQPPNSDKPQTEIEYSIREDTRAKIENTNAKIENSGVENAQFASTNFAFSCDENDETARENSVDFSRGGAVKNSVQATQNVPKLTSPNLTVLVCTLAAEPIDGHRRAQWVRETFPDVRVLHVTEEVPAYPNEHPDFWRIWRDLIRRNAPEADTIFSSEDYGARLAQELGIAHIDIDKARRHVPVSATRVRENPLRHWQFLPRAVRPYFAKRVLVFGAESTGKSTLCRQLAAHFRTVWVPEFAREFYDEKGVNFEYSDVARIAYGQQESEETRAFDANRLLFCDTDALTNAIYSRVFYGRVPHFLQRLANERRYDLVLFCANDLPWQSDPQRDSVASQRALQQIFRAELESRRIEFIEIYGQGEARLQRAVAAVETHFGAENLAL